MFKNGLTKIEILEIRIEHSKEVLQPRLFCHFADGIIGWCWIDLAPGDIVKGLTVDKLFAFIESRIAGAIVSCEWNADKLREERKRV